MAVNVSGEPLSFEASIGGNFNTELSKIERGLAGLATSAEKQSAAFDSILRKATAAVAAYASFTAGGNFLQNLVQIRGEFQQLEVAFTTMLGSKEKADKLMAEVTQFAATTPFELKDVAAATKQLLAFGISAGDIKETLRQLGDVSAGIGAPLGDIAYLFGTIKTQGVAMTQDVRQFAQRGIPIYEELSRVLGVSVEKVGEFITAGKVGFLEIQKAFQGMTAEGSKFGGLMEASSKTLTGLQSNLRDAVDQMFNDLGKSTQGVFADAIKGATVLVQNYEKVIDVLKAIAITYGTYRTALLATVVVERVSVAMQIQRALAGRALTTAQALQAAATVTLQRVTKSLNATMLANPYVAVATAVAGLVSALVLLSDNTTAQERAQNSLNEANEKYKQDVENLRNKTSELVSIIQSQTSTQFQQVQAFNELKTLYPELLKSMDLIGFKTLAAEDAQKRFNDAIDKTNMARLRDQLKEAQTEIARFNELLTARELGVGAADLLRGKLEEAQIKAGLLGEELQKAEQAMWEANTPVEKQIEHYSKIKDSLTSQRAEVEKTLEGYQKLGLSAFDFRVTVENTNLNNLNAQIDTVNQKLLALSGTDVNATKDKAYWEKQKADAQSVIDQLDVNDKNFNKVKGDQIVKIREAETQLRKYDTALKQNTRSTSDNNSRQNQLNSLLERRKSILKGINDLIEDSRNAEKSDTEKEIIAINKRYEEAIATITDYNKKVDEFKKKNPGTQVQKIGLDYIQELSKVRLADIDSARLKEQKQIYEKQLQEQAEIFQRYEDLKLEVGTEKARELMAEQTKGFDNFIEFIQAQEEALFSNIKFGVGNKGDLQKYQQLQEMLAAYSKKRADKEVEDAARNFSNLVQATVTYNDAKAAINAKYDQLERDLAKDNILTQKDQRAQILQQSRQEELDALESTAARQTDLYRKLNQDIISFTRDRIKQEIKLLEEKLKSDKTLTPEMKANIQATIARYQGLLQETNETARDFAKLAGQLSGISGIFGDLAGALSGVNDGMADTLSTIGEIVGVAGSAADAIASFSSGDIIGGISNTIKAITGIFSIGKKARESERKAQEEIAAFNQRILAGELEITQEYRQRQREQVKLNQLKLEGLQTEKEILQQQKQAAAEQYNSLLQQLQQQTYIVGQTTKKYGGILGIGRKTKAVEITETLAGKSYADLEKLFATGQLTGRAKELFELLQKVKQEGLDIDSLLLENQREAAELLTGTTADNIVDAIASGFADGRKSIADFADDFEGMMRQAVINALKYKYLEAPLTEFYDELSAAVQSDGQLTQGEIQQLSTLYNSIIENAQNQFEQLQQISGISLSQNAGSRSNSLTGAIKGITEQQAELLAGQFGGLRITALEQLNIAKRQLDNLNQIQVNTSLTVSRLAAILDTYRAWESGLKKIHVQM